LRATNPVEVIGTRHGEKLYETLLTREEKARAQDLGGYYRVPTDNRDLNYAIYFSEGMPQIANAEDYTSHNTRRLELAEMMALLQKLPEIREAQVRRGIAFPAANLQAAG
jgi:UDP-glucose 4-epimerase